MKRTLVTISPWMLAAACALLTVILGVFALNNYNREKELMLEALLQKSQNILHSVLAGVRVSFRASSQFRGAEELKLTDHFQNVLEQVFEQGEIHFLYLVDSDGNILAAGIQEKTGSKIDEELMQFVRNSPIGRESYRMKEAGKNSPAGFQIAHSFLSDLPGNARLSPRGPHWNMPHHMMPWMDGMGWGRRLRDELDKLQIKNIYLVVELDVDQFDSAVRQQLAQIIVLSVVLLLVGAGGLLSLMTLQNWRGSQRRLGRLSALHDVLLHSLPVGVVTVDRGLMLRLVNPVAEEILGQKAVDLVGKQSQGNLPDSLQKAVDDILTGAYRVVREVTTSSHDGRLRDLALFAHQIQDEKGRMTGVVLLLQDVSEIKLLERELQRHERLAALGKMAAGVAHELRNPLSSIKGLALLVQSKVSDESGSEAAQVLVGEVERLNRSIGELLEYARPEKLVQERCRITEVITEAMQLVKLDAASMQVEIEFDATCDTDWVCIDKDKIKQVFLNLFLNAFQAMEHGGKLRIAVTQLSTMLQISVQDSGQGILPEDLPRIFDPYFTTKSTGSGLGLALSAKIVEEHGGKIVAESEYQAGTLMKVFLPLGEGGI